MKKKLLLLLTSLLIILGLSAFTSPVSAASYGRSGHVITPVNMRGKWLYRGSTDLGQNPNKIYKVKIGRHHINGLKLYQANLNVTSKYALHFKKYRFVIAQTMNWGRATIFNRDGRQWLNVTGWTAGAGNGTSYAVTSKTVSGKVVPVLLIGIGYKPFVVAHAYLKPPKQALTYSLAN